ncbi:unnamed protein product, partial [marine sediment metagenome]
ATFLARAAGLTIAGCDLVRRIQTSSVLIGAVGCFNFLIKTCD